MSYYFPFGATDALSTNNINASLLATTASVPLNSNVSAITASYAITTLDTPTAGTPGTSVTQAECEANTSAYISGSQGQQGPTGSKGPDNTVCPPGTVRCMALEVSLSAQYIDAFTSGANAYVPSGSQYSIVCMQIPTTCSSAQAQAGCPDYLYISQPNIP